MKKLLMIALFAIVAVGASAQKNITVWWGGNIADVGGDIKADAAFKALNIGVAYTAPITDEFDWSAGLSYATKGCENWDPGFLQIEGNGAWNFVNNGDAKVGIFTGPYLAFMVAKDEEAALRIRRILSEGALNDRARFVEMSLSGKGLEVSRS